MSFPGRTEIITTAVAVMVGTTAAQAAFYRCNIAEKWSCSPGRARMQNTVTITNFIETDQKFYYRCDQKRCDKHAVELEASGPRQGHDRQDVIAA
jgi:hypothetical protein